jgi:hypothetical protein
MERHGTKLSRSPGIPGVGKKQLTLGSISQELLLYEEQGEQAVDHTLVRRGVVLEAHGGNQVHEETVAQLPELGVFLDGSP